jgi:hypothetical protein
MIRVIKSNIAIVCCLEQPISCDTVRKANGVHAVELVVNRNGEWDPVWSQPNEAAAVGNDGGPLCIVVNRECAVGILHDTSCRTEASRYLLGLFHILCGS